MYKLTLFNCIKLEMCCRNAAVLFIFSSEPLSKVYHFHVIEIQHQSNVLLNGGQFESQSNVLRL